jgi:hypothetical protein
MPAGAEAGSLALNTGTDILPYRVPRAELTVPERRDIILVARPVVVGGPGHAHRHAVGLPVRQGDQVRARLGRRVRHRGRQRRGLAGGPGRQRPVHLVGRHVHEPADPGRPRCLQEHAGAEHVRGQEIARLEERAVHVRLRGKVDHRRVPGHQPGHQVRVQDAALGEGQLRGQERVPEVLPAARVSQRVEHRDPGNVPGRQEPPDEVRPDEPSAAGDEYVMHGLLT